MILWEDSLYLVHSASLGIHSNTDIDIHREYWYRFLHSYICHLLNTHSHLNKKRRIHGRFNYENEWIISYKNYSHMTRPSLVTQSHKKPLWWLMCAGPDRLRLVAPEKAVNPNIQFRCKVWVTKEENLSKKSCFAINCQFLVLTRTFQSLDSGHMIKYLLTETPST